MCVSAKRWRRAWWGHRAQPRFARCISEALAASRHQCGIDFHSQLTVHQGFPKINTRHPRHRPCAPKRRLRGLHRGNVFHGSHPFRLCQIGQSVAIFAPVRRAREIASLQKTCTVFGGIASTAPRHHRSPSLLRQRAPKLRFCQFHAGMLRHPAHQPDMSNRITQNSRHGQHIYKMRPC